MPRAPAFRLCPFCGASVRELRVHLIMDDLGRGRAVYCGYCDARGPVARTARGNPSTRRAIELWNDRSGKAAHAG